MEPTLTDRWHVAAHLQVAQCSVGRVGPFVQNRIRVGSLARTVGSGSVPGSGPRGWNLHGAASRDFHAEFGGDTRVEEWVARGS